MAKEIPLTQGKVAIVDDEDHEWLSQYNWYYARDRAARGVLCERGTRIHFMHNYIMHPPPGYFVDHIDRDAINNQRSNLRICTHAENTRNRIYLSSRKLSLYKGVSPVAGSKINPWKAAIGIGGKQIHLGNFSTQEAAALAYNEAALKYHGEFARLNAIESPAIMPDI